MGARGPSGSLAPSGITGKSLSAMLHWLDDHHCVLDGTVFELKDVEDTGTKEAASDLVLLKPRWMTERYVMLRDRFTAANVLELGIHRGGSTAFLALLLRPRRLVAVDIKPSPALELTHFLARSELRDSIRTFHGVDQSDRTRLEEIVTAQFGDQPLDLVIDDASHLLQPTTASFNLLFPRLRNGGLFVIEDWSADHAFERGIASSPELLARIAAGGTLAVPPTPASRLVLEIVLGAAYAPDLFAHVELVQGWFAVERGPAPLDPSSFDISACYGRLAERMLASS